MKTIRVILMSLAVVIGVGGAFASSSRFFVSKWVSVNASGTPGQNADITVPSGCNTSNTGNQCQVSSGTHAGKYIFETGPTNPLRMTP